MTKRLLIALLAAVALLPRPASAQLNVVTSTTDLADIARAVGGQYVKVKSIGAGYEDPHFIQAKPSFVLDMRKAQVWAFVGLDLEAGWMPLLLDGARNSKIRLGGSGYVDVSKVIDVKDVQKGGVDRSQGDVHALGNPHYWLNPDNGQKIAKLFEDKFAQLDPKHEAVFEANRKAFAAQLAAAEAQWNTMRAQTKGKPIVAWHTSWKYLADYTGVNIVGYMEPKPGVPPSPTHLAGLIATIKRTGAKVIIMEPFYDRKMADFVARNTGVKVLVLPSSVGGVKGVDSYVELISHNLAQLSAAVR
jgi:zinc/manganese transport system substrate-binding protein